MPHGRKVLLQNVVYEANIFPMESSNEEKVYIGISAGNWKEWFYNYKHPFTNLLLRNQTVLSRWFWSLKEGRQTPQIKWKFIKKIFDEGKFWL